MLRKAAHLAEYAALSTPSSLYHPDLRSLLLPFYKTIHMTSVRLRHLNYHYRQVGQIWIWESEEEQTLEKEDVVLGSECCWGTCLIFRIRL